MEHLIHKLSISFYEADTIVSGKGSNVALWLNANFSEIENPLHKGYVKHKLADVLTDVCGNVPNDRTLRNNGFCRKQSGLFGKKLRYINSMKKFVGDDSEAVDGKPRSALQIITAYMTEIGLILGQEKNHGRIEKRLCSGRYQ